MLTSIHFLTTYTCNFECDHCFLYCGPRERGTFRIEQIQAVLEEAKRLGTIDSVFFEGGEPFLFYPLVLEGIERARRLGIKSGIVTNAYWATSVEDAELWLRPLAHRGVATINVSDDALHYGDPPGAHAQRVTQAAQRVGMAAKIMCTDRPKIVPAEPSPPGTAGAGGTQNGSSGKGGTAKGTAQEAGVRVGGGVMFRGRAVEKLAAGLPGRPWEGLNRCPHENLASPGRVHADCYGNVHLCQGLSMGNLWQTPFSQLVRDYRPQEHPIVAPLLAGGPAELVRRYSLPHEAEYIDECHLCFAARRALIDRFPQFLAPPQVYGLGR
jgi:hypothetical protein